MSKPLFTAFIALLTSGTATMAAETCSLPQVADTAALTPVTGSNLMTVPVAINGKPKLFLLNIGSGPMEVSQAAVADLGLPEAAKMTSTIQLGGTGSMANMGAQQGLTLNAPVYDVKGNQVANAMRARVRVGAFTIGGATANNLQFIVANDGEIAKDAPYDGLLSTDILRQYDFELDFAGKQINFLTPVKCTDPNQVVFWSHYEIGVIPMNIVNAKIVVPVTVEGHPLDAVIDTSSARTVLRRDIAELTLGYKAGAPGMTPSGDLKDGKGETVYAHSFSQIAFAGGVTAINVPALIQTNSMLSNADRQVVLGSKALSAEARIPDFSLGMDVLHQLHMYIVFGQKKLYVTANQ